MSRSIYGLFILLFLAACNTPKIAGVEETVITEQRQLDTLFVSAPPITEEEEEYELPVYNPSATQENDLLHTRLELRFDWEKEQVIGQAHLKLKPYFYPTATLTLDAKMFEFKTIALADGTPLKYDYDNRLIHIQLDKTYTRKETYDIFIDYVVIPQADGGSAAISSDKGLFFINPRGEDANKPMQIWTQGETENNSRWFPTIDKPNERCTQEMFITVQDKYETLSNGILVSSTDNEDGTRTDYWNMDKPHAPYLFMLAVGEFAVVEDDPWNGTVPVNYYVEQEYEADAKAIFPHTLEMLTFFSDITGVTYPWQKYSQIIVRDYVSGAMENTTGVIFGEFIQNHSRELIDVLINDKIVAHEMMHHWFGDYVTCENWANLTLNEGFANYSEYLWLENKYGRDEADYHLLEEWDGYLSSTAGGIHPLIHYGYDDKEHMFDAHSYNKGGSILHMLRNIIGDDAFFAGLQKYLEDNALSAVEANELRLAFEDITGQDLQWFFDQWFFDQGHPSLKIDYDYDDGEAIIHVDQLQDTEEMPAIFQLPAAIDIYIKGQEKPIRKIVTVDQRNQTFRISVSEQPALIIFDAERNILAEWEDNKTDNELVYQFMHAPLLADRFQAITQISDPDKFNQILVHALQDDFYGIREIALQSIGEEEELPEAIMDQVFLMAQKEPHSDVRSAALSILASFDDVRSLTVAKKALDAQAYNVVAAGLEAIYQISPTEGEESAKKLIAEKNPDIIAAIGSIFAETGKVEYLNYFENHLLDVDGYAALNFYSKYAEILSENKPASLSSSIKTLAETGIDQSKSPWLRFASINALSKIKTEFLAGSASVDSDSDVYPYIETLSAAIENIKDKESVPQLKTIYQQF